MKIGGRWRECWGRKVRSGFHCSRGCAHARVKELLEEQQMQVPAREAWKLLVHCGVPAAAVPGLTGVWVPELECCGQVDG